MLLHVLPLSLYNCLSPLCNGVCVTVFVYWYLCIGIWVCFQSGKKKAPHSRRNAMQLPDEAVVVHTDVVTRNERKQYGSACQLLTNVQELLCHGILLYGWKNTPHSRRSEDGAIT